MSKGLSVRVEPKLLTEKGMWPCQHVSGRFGFHLIFDSFFPLVSCVYIYIIAFNCTHIIYTYLYIYMYYVYIHRVIYIYTHVFFSNKTNPLTTNPSSPPSRSELKAFVVCWSGRKPETHIVPGFVFLASRRLAGATWVGFMIFMGVKTLLFYLDRICMFSPTNYRQLIDQTSEF